MSTTTWHEAWAPAHPVRYSDAGGLEPDRYISIADAVERLARYGFEPESTWVSLEAGVQLRTPFAFYRAEPADPALERAATMARETPADVIAGWLAGYRAQGRAQDARICERALEIQAAWRRAQVAGELEPEEAGR